ncbi:MAG: tRNA uridine(34) 5-carboxymethylaminomethyl modification radical SAM/GNAT enzyme Elp3, partial [Candidatus Bathyarchaeia archaeon]
MSYGNESALREIVESLMRIPSPSPDDVNRVKVRVAAKYRLGKIPSNPEIIAFLRGNEERRKLLPVLRRKATRTISGVTVVAVMTQPYPCP